MYMYVCKCIYMYLCMYVSFYYLYTCSYLSIYPSISLSIYLSIYLSISLHVSIYLSSYRLDAIAATAELQEKSLSELEQLSVMLHDGCVEAVELHKQILKANGKHHSLY